MVKFDVISGFLGAGKTTFIQKILKSLGDEKIVIIENEYGETQIDREVLSIAGFEIYELTNGCVCCTLKEDFRLTLREILNQKVDRIIFEPSGIFVLGEIFELFKDLQISSRCSLNSVITVVDALNFFKHVNGYSGFFANQIELASSLVVSKSQYIDDKEMGKIQDQLRQMNPTALMVTEVWEGLTDEKIFELLANKPERIVNKWPFQADHDFETIGFQTTKRFTAEELGRILMLFEYGKYGQVLRGKGIVQGQESALEFNYVDGYFDIDELKESTYSAVSFIGTALNEEELKKAFT